MIASSRSTMANFKASSRLLSWYRRLWFSTSDCKLQSSTYCRVTWTLELIKVRCFLKTFAIQCHSTLWWEDVAHRTWSWSFMISNSFCLNISCSWWLKAAILLAYSASSSSDLHEAFFGAKGEGMALQTPLTIGYGKQTDPPTIEILVPNR